MLFEKLHNTYLTLTFTAFFILCLSCGTKEVEDGRVSSPYRNENGRNDLWDFVGPGGGGAMFNPSINPMDSNNVYVSCDMTGSYVTYNGGDNWRMFNLRGMTKFYVFDGKNPNIAYTGTSNLLFKTKDKGFSWEVIYPEPEEIVSIHGQGDHANEVVVTKDSILVQIEKMVVDPENDQKLYLLTRKRKRDLWPPVRGKGERFFMEILVSEDGGKQWTVQDRLRFDLDNIFIDPTSPVQNRTIYVSGKAGLGTRIGGVWRQIELPGDIGPVTQYTDGWDLKTDTHIIYVIAGKSYFNPKGKTNESRLYKTSDGGKSWVNLNSGVLELRQRGQQNPEFRSIATSYHNPETLYLSISHFVIDRDTTSFGVLKSTDFGKTWEMVWDDRVLTRNGELLSSANRTKGWLDDRFGPQWGENPFHMAIDANDPDICYATDFGRTIKTSNGGETWKQVYTRATKDGGWASTGLQVTTGYMLAFDPFDPDHIFMANTDTGLLESMDGGQGWRSATNKNGVPKAWVNSTYWITFDPEEKDKVWAVMSANHDLPRPKMWRNRDMDDYKGGILVSANGGRTWEPVQKGMDEFAATHILIDKFSQPYKRTLYVCGFGKGVLKSVDGGISWKLKNNGITEKQPAAWRVTQNESGHLFLIVARKDEDGTIGGEGGGSIYKSTDGAETWEKISLPEGVNAPTSLVMDPENSERLLLSSWGGYGETEFSADRGGGIHVSDDNGNSWRTVFSKDQHIHDITVDEENSVFYASGFNSSAYRSDDQGETWSRMSGFNFKWGKRVEPDPKDKDMVYVITFGGGVWHGPAQGDKNAIEDIATKAASFTK